MKAVLVIDKMPDICWRCPYGKLAQRGYRFCDLSAKLIPGEDFKPDWCPLRPLPEKRNTTNFIEMMHEAEENHVASQHQAGFNRGWNACLEAITGGTHE